MIHTQLSIAAAHTDLIEESDESVRLARHELL